MRKIEVGVAQADLARLVKHVAGGEEIVLANAGKPVARLVVSQPRRQPGKPDLLEGKIWIAEDLDEPLPQETMAAFRGGRP